MKELFYLFIVIASWVVAGLLGISLVVLIVSVTRVFGWLGALITPFTEQTKRKDFPFIR